MAFEDPQSRDPFLMLSFDGGGIRGLLSARLLQRLSEDVPGLMGAVDMVVGTSTGGIIAAGLASGMTPEQVVGLYVDNAEAIFTPYPSCVPFTRAVIKPEYTSGPMHELLLKYIPGAPRLGDLSMGFMATSFQLNNPDTGTWGPELIHNFPRSPWNDLLLTDAAMRTAAPPVLMPVYQGSLDGGVVANNPSTVAVALALDPDVGGQRHAAMRVLSFGCGNNPGKIEGSPEWGALQWVNPLYHPPMPLVVILLDSMCEIEAYTTRHLLGAERFMRLNPALDRFIRLDDWKVTQELLDIADAFPAQEPDLWAATVAWLEALVAER